MIPRQRILFANRSSLFDGLISYWKNSEVSGTHYDLVGGNNLTNTNSVPQVAGKTGPAAGFTAASSQKLSIASNASLQMGAAVDFTFTAQVYFVAKTGWAGLVGKYSGVFLTQEYILYYDQTADRITFYGTNSGGTQVACAATTLGSPALSTWYHVRFGWRASDAKLFISVNNGATDIAALATGCDTDTNAFVIGDDYAAAYMDGRIGEVKMWKRLLTAQECAEDYANFVNGKPLA